MMVITILSLVITFYMNMLMRMYPSPRTPENVRGELNPSLALAGITVLIFVGSILYENWPAVFVGIVAVTITGLIAWNDWKELRKAIEAENGEVLQNRWEVVDAAERVLDTAVRLNIGMPPELTKALNTLGKAVNAYREGEPA
jgi:hypothetical protein